MIMGSKKEMEQKKEIGESKEGGRLKDTLTKLGKTLKRILPMKETLAAVSIGIMSQALPSCTTRFDIKDVETEDARPDTPPDVTPDVTPDTPTEADVPVDMEPDGDVIEDMEGDDGREPCPPLPEVDVRVNDIELLQGESITVNSITVTAETIDADTSEVRYTFACSGIPLEGGLTVRGEPIIRTRSYPEDNIHIIINQQDVMSDRVLFDVTVRDTS